MDSVQSEDVQCTGGHHTIKIGVTFEDRKSPDYKHSIVWGFEPTLATEGKHPILEVRTILHKKYSNNINPDYTIPTQDDGSEVINHGGWTDGPFTTDAIPNSVKDKLSEMFGDELAENTIKNPQEVLDIDCEFSEVTLPNIPNKHTVILPEFIVEIHGSYVNHLSKEEADQRDVDYTSHMKDANTGEIKDTYYPVNHNLLWVFSPVKNESGLQVEKCVHKTWNNKMSYDFEENYDGEQIIEAYKTPAETPNIDELPRAILLELTEWFGTPLMEQMLAGTNTNIPTYAYDCYNCDELSVSTPRKTCPKCGSENKTRYDSVENYNQVMNIGE